MTELAEDIRRRAQRARHLSKSAHDKIAAANLEDLAADLTKRAQELEAEAVAMAARAEIAQQHAADAHFAATKIRDQIAVMKAKPR